MARITLPDVELTEDEQEHLFALIHKGSHSARVITRARILSKLVKSLSNQEVCSALEVTLPTVLKTRKRLAEGGLQAALGELPRPGFKPKLDATQAAIESRPSPARRRPTGTITGRYACWARRLWSSALPSPTATKACASCSKKRTQALAKAAVVHHTSR